MSAGPSDQWSRQDALAKMDLVKITRSYIEKMLDSVPGYKALLVDKETVRILSTVFTQTELGIHDVFCTERIDAKEQTKHNELKVVWNSILTLITLSRRFASCVRPGRISHF